MGELGDRLRKARVAAGFQSASKAATALGVAVSTYSAHENGQNDYGPKEAAVYARKFKVTPEWLLLGRNTAVPTMIDRNVLRGVVRHIAREYPEIISVDPNELTDAIVNLCEYVQESSKGELTRAESGLAIKRMLVAGD